MNKKKVFPKIVAHRGDMEHFPENTLASFQSAIDKGADVIELDVHQTKDNEIVVHHDFYLDRHTNGQGFIGDHTLKELKRLDAGSWFDESFSSENIPTLLEVLEIGKGKTRFEIEIKTPSKFFAKNVIKLIESNNLTDKVEITCQQRLLISTINLINTKIDFGLILYSFPDGWKKHLALLNCLNI